MKNTTNFAKIIKTPSDAAGLLERRKAQNQELADAAKAVYDAFFDELNTSGDKLAEQLQSLAEQRDGIVDAKETAKQAMVAATVSGDAAAVKAQQKALKDLDAQLASIDEQMGVFETHILCGDLGLYHKAKAAIERVIKDNDDMDEFRHAVKEEVERRAKEWMDVFHSTVERGAVPDVQKLDDRIYGDLETVRERNDCLAREAVAEEDRQRRLAAQEEYFRKLDEEKEAARIRAAKPAPFRMMQDEHGHVWNEKYNPSTGQYERIHYTP